jgi:hypothetical protein
MILKMINEDDSESEVLSELDTDLKDLLAYVDIKIELSDADEKHDVLIRTEQRCTKFNCSVKIMQLIAQLVLQDIDLQHN